MIVYEEFESPGDGRITNRFVRAASYETITEDLLPGETETYTISTPELSGVVWDNLEWVALADYRPGGRDIGPWDTIQAFLSNKTTAITREWNGDFDDQWHDADNWTPSGTPGFYDQVEIGESFNDPVIGVGEASVHFVSVASGMLTVTGGPLTIR